MTVEELTKQLKQFPGWYQIKIGDTEKDTFDTARLALNGTEVLLTSHYVL